jgi:hypothetical protein
VRLGEEIIDISEQKAKYNDELALCQDDADEKTEHMKSQLISEEEIKAKLEK